MTKYSSKPIKKTELQKALNKANNSITAQSIHTANEERIMVSSHFTTTNKVDILTQDFMSSTTLVRLNKDEVEQLITILQESIKDI